MTSLPPPRDWLDQAACKDMDTALFFPERGDVYTSAAPALAACARCEVRDECMADALYYGDRVGIRGGVLATQRKGYRKQRAAVAQCGTESGYSRHRRKGEEACDECKAAHVAYNARQYSRERKRGTGVIHGTDSTGYGRGCSCASCTSAHRVAAAVYRQRVAT